MRFGGSAIASATLLCASPALAQDAEPICADRPGLGTPTCTVPAGKVQFEATFIDWTRDRAYGVRTTDTSLGDTAIKFGLTDRAHAEVIISPYVRSSTRAGGETETHSGFGDVAIAGKYRLTRDEAPIQVAVWPYVKIPTAKRPLGNRQVEGGVVVPIEYEVPGTALSLSLSPQFDVNADGDGSGHHLGTAQVVGLEVPLSARLGAAFELWGYWDFDPEGTVRQYAFGASAGYLITNDVQVDAGLNLGLNRDTPDAQLYSGIAFRF